MKTAEPMHFVHNYLINPTNPIRVNLMGAGGTGSNMIMELAKLNRALVALGHAGFQVQLWDNDTVSELNTLRQLFAKSEIGLNKAVARINAVNRFWGTNWKAVQHTFSDNELPYKQNNRANIYISCVDKIAARFEIAAVLKKLADENNCYRDIPLYWMDLGNAQFTGQVILSTISKIKQPDSKLYKPVSYLPFVTDEFKELLESQSDEDVPSCSAAEALDKQGLFINAEVAKKAACLLTDMFRSGMTANRGIFTNLNTYVSQPLKVA
ncbi:MAG: PRTRC system ThiF family protein [Candidatus Pedobacter colombiensis]|uniref:PRTRC system ThiF family protein n=1 Tax=Candidatus Pedobacter colombiensis TaxID=3121371 RepID=A0AAJ5W4K4_9SPHI|nr:PRTRC system ThiF family protein [Pedobacter sp.]WEK17949.1 MAG: PRTRC system ThiF family protein [Pedobacter sp.]